jgi:RNA polymerase sigma-70 factor, ECF subfamily
LRHRIDQEIGPQPIGSRSLPAGSDREALNNLFGSQRRRLFFSALRLLGSPEDAEDAVQEGLLEAFRNLHRFEGRARFSTWLHRIVVNAALMRLRSRRTHESRLIDEPVMQPGSTRLCERLVDARPNPEEVFIRTERLHLLKQGLQGLSRLQRRALSLHFQGMTTKDAANALGVSKAAVKSQVHRARRKLSENVSS